ncbi:MAG TPA: nitroreductase family protein [Firmicutes bacterium]|nr:nitroreductase family protein [Bacillota bacterium]
MTKDLIEAIEQRHSVRAFEDRPVPAATIGRIVDCGRMAPSAGNIQPWEFWVIRRPDLKAALARAAYGQDFVATAPVVIVVCAEPGRSASRYGERGSQLYCLQDTAAAVENMLLAAVAFGLGACWVGAFDEAEASKALRLPGRLRPVAIIPVGYPAETDMRPRHRPLRPREETIVMVD